MLHPQPLTQGDKVVIVSPSGKIDAQYVHGAIDVLNHWGLQAGASENALKSAGMFSGFVEQRLSDLQRAMDDPEVKLILCSRGGYGAIHLIDRLNFEGIKTHPKWLIGYSDITALHAALQSKGILSIHGPMAKHFSTEGPEDVSVLYTKTLLAGQPIRYKIPVNYPHLDREGFVAGKLFGGNLSVFCGMLGSKYIKIPKGGILIIEDVAEKPYKVDRMIHQLKHAGVFDKIGGMIVGQFSDFEEDNQLYDTLFESICHVLQPYDFPVCFGFPVGHERLNFPIVLGAKARLNVKKDTISFKQF